MTPRVTLRDATLREGLDTPHVSFSAAQKLRIARMLAQAGVAEAEVVAPSRVAQDVEFARTLREEGIALRTSGLIYSHGENCAYEVELASASLDHGAGFPHSLQCDPEFLLEISAVAIARGARRIVVYDTNGGGDPFAVAALIRTLRERQPQVEIFFHSHNDLGLATANAWAAVNAGADGLDVTVNGLGDRAGNASLEQVAMVLHLKGYQTGIHLDELAALSRAVADESGVVVSKLSPVVGEYALWHKSPSHLRKPGLFEAFDPALVRTDRTVDGS